MNNNKRALRQVVAAIDHLAPAEPLRARDSSRPDTAPGRRGGAHLGRLLAALSNHEALEAQRRASPLMGYIGPNGGGKTATLVRDTLSELRAGRKVLSNLPIFDPVTKEPFPSFTLLEDYDQLAAAEDSTIVLDEIVATASSRQNNLPYQVEYLTQTMRHSGNTLRWTAPAWARADKLLREVTQAVTECRGYYSDHSAVRGNGQRHAVALWAPKRLFHLRTFDTVDFDEWTSGRRDKLKSEVREWWWGPDSDVFASYDTLAQVVRVAESNESGRCLRCGGTRRAKPCRCGVLHDEAVA